MAVAGEPVTVGIVLMLRKTACVFLPGAVGIFPIGGAVSVASATTPSFSLVKPAAYRARVLVGEALLRINGH